MEQPINKYTFLPWFRKGLGNLISGSAGLRPTFKITVTPNIGNPVLKDIQLYGPQDVLGISERMIIRNEPRNGAQDVEDNYLACIEFYEEDFPWRYTPESSDGSAPDRLRPWLFLLVLHEAEFKMINSKPLPSVEVNVPLGNVLPPHSETWAWAHVQVNQADNPAEPEIIIATNPDLSFSRLVSPRRFAKGKRHDVFLIPAYENGRLAGLGLTPNAPAAKGSWAGNELKHTFPYYHHWSFRSADKLGDFESMVADLKVQIPDPGSIGQRPMDVGNPNFGTSWNEENRILLLEGALRIPRAGQNNWELTGNAGGNTRQNWPGPTGALPSGVLPEFQKGLQDLINLPYDQKDKGDPVPVVSVPFYGSRHALKDRIAITNDDQTDDWLTELNRDPRERAAAGLGAEVIRVNQEEYADTAWQQVEGIRAANRLILKIQTAIHVNYALFRKNFASLPTGKLLALTPPLFDKIKASPTTIFGALKESPIPFTVLSGTFRRLIRARGSFTRRLSGRPGIDPGGFVAAFNDGRLKLPMPALLAATAETIGNLGKQLASNAAIPAWLRPVLKLPFWLLLLLAILFAVFSWMLAPAWIATAATLAGAAFLAWSPVSSNIIQSSEHLEEGKISGSDFRNAPPNPDFSIVNPAAANSNTPWWRRLSWLGATDSDSAADFRVAASELITRLNPPVAPPVQPIALDLTALTTKIARAAHPVFTQTARLAARIPYRSVKDPSGAPVLPLENVREVMDYPRIDTPMYKPLKDLPGGDDYILPGIEHIQENSILLMETNRRFIESYMVGVNVEFGSELLWREYPTDQAGSYFRRFWNHNGTLLANNSEYDIAEIHRWSLDKAPLNLGNNAAAGGTGENLVLVIRSKLFKRYPNTVLFAQAAIPVEGGYYEAGIAHELIPDFVNPEANEKLIRPPIFSAVLADDVYCFGFKLKKEEAVMDKDKGQLGWFFVFMERPGEPRFGLDEGESDTKLETWQDLSWQHLIADPTRLKEGNFVLQSGKTLRLDKPIDADKQKLWQEDKNASWFTDSAHMAYILLQNPVKRAIHTNKLLSIK